MPCSRCVIAECEIEHSRELSPWYSRLLVPSLFARARRSRARGKKIEGAHSRNRWFGGDVDALQRDVWFARAAKRDAIDAAVRERLGATVARALDGEARRAACVLRDRREFLFTARERERERRRGVQ